MTKNSIEIQDQLEKSWHTITDYDLCQLAKIAKELGHTNETLKQYASDSFADKIGRVFIRGNTCDIWTYRYAISDSIRRYALFGEIYPPIKCSDPASLRDKLLN